jgi:hypothetical protein
MNQECNNVQLMQLTAKFARKMFKNKAVITNHFMQRMFQRFDGDTRRRIFAELYDLCKFGMYPALFEAGQTTALVTIHNNISLAVIMKGDKLVLKTVYRANKKAKAS